MRLRDLLLSKPKANVVLNGKAGRGKSVFLLYLIFYIILSAKERRECDSTVSDNHLINPIIIYVKRNGSKFLISLEKVEVLNSKVSPHYYFSDNVDVSEANVGSFLTICATSGDIGTLREFNKRKDECSGPTYTMPSLEFEEMKLIFPEMNDEELQFKYDIFGGNPRLFHGIPSFRRDLPYYTTVYNSFVWLFDSDFVPRDGESSSKRQLIGDWAINTIVSKLENALSLSSNTDSSLFKHYIVNEDCILQSECFVSTFMSFIAASLQENYDKTIISSLLKLFGSSGIGNAFEMTAHAKLLASSGMHSCLDLNGNLVNLPLGSRQKVFVRTIADLQSLVKGQYGFPTICNFPLVDAILAPDIALNMTIGKSHRGAISKLNDITNALGIASNQLKMVFVVPKDSIKTFIFPKDLGDTQVFLTTADEITEDALTGEERPKTVKRKVCSVSK